MLRAENLTMRFGSHQALDNLNLDVAAGEIFCLLGANGAGKTTTINLFLGFLEPTSGSARVDGHDAFAASTEARKQLAYIPEQVALYPRLTGLQNLDYLTSLATMRRATPEQLRAMLREVGLPAGAEDRKVSTYSKGMRQKVGIAAAVAKGARALLLDEPTSGLDPQASNEFSQLLMHLKGQGVAMLMATHDLFRAKETGTRLGIMRSGVLRQVLRADEIGHADLEELYLQHMSD